MPTNGLHSSYSSTIWSGAYLILNATFRSYHPHIRRSFAGHSFALCYRQNGWNLLGSYWYAIVKNRPYESRLSEPV